MKAWFLGSVKDLSIEKDPLYLSAVDVPVPGKNEILIKISACGVCHTELDEIEGRTPPKKFPVIPGHQVIGTVAETGASARRFRVGERVGVAWIFSACGHCEYCKSGRENICPEFIATGRDANGGYAEFMTVNENFAYSIPENLSDAEAAPLLCAGAIGYRSIRLTNLHDGETLGLSGFGASGHLVLKMARYMFPASPIIVFARSKEEQKFALELGAAWAGDVVESPPVKPQAVIDTTPVWTPVVNVLSHLKPGGRLVINAIRKESQDINALSGIVYETHLWMEKEIKSVANITRSDVIDFLQIAAKSSIRPEIETYPFEDANRALLELKNKHIKGAKVLLMPSLKAK